MLSAISIDGVPATTRADDQMTTSQRLEAIGRMTGGVAHDFNNLLTVIMGATEALAAALKDDSEQHELAVTGLLAAERGAELVRRLLAPSRQQARRLRAIDCNVMIDEIASMVRRVIRGDVRLEVLRTDCPVCCVADHIDLTSALMNLCLNARDALPSGGELSLAVDRVLLSAAAAEGHGLPPGPYVAITVRDNGAGMSAATLKRALEPFFTTKGEGGVGLGLATSHAFARESGGQLAIASRKGEGTTVTLYLPPAHVDGRSGPPADIWLLETSHVS